MMLVACLKYELKNICDFQDRVEWNILICKVRRKVELCLRCIKHHTMKGCKGAEF
jgi:hypothetical protein